MGRHAYPYPEYGLQQGANSFAGTPQVEEGGHPNGSVYVEAHNHDAAKQDIDGIRSAGNGGARVGVDALVGMGARGMMQINQVSQPCGLPQYGVAGGDKDQHGLRRQQVLRLWWRESRG